MSSLSGTTGCFQLCYLEYLVMCTKERQSYSLPSAFVWLACSYWKWETNHSVQRPPRRAEQRHQAQYRRYNVAQQTLGWCTNKTVGSVFWAVLWGFSDSPTTCIFHHSFPKIWFTEAIKCNKKIPKSVVFHCTNGVVSGNQGQGGACAFQQVTWFANCWLIENPNPRGGKCAQVHVCTGLKISASRLEV